MHKLGFYSKIFKMQHKGDLGRKIRAPYSVSIYENFNPNIGRLLDVDCVEGVYYAHFLWINKCRIKCRYYHSPAVGLTTEIMVCVWMSVETKKIFCIPHYISMLIILKIIKPYGLLSYSNYNWMQFIITHYERLSLST